MFLRRPWGLGETTAARRYAFDHLNFLVKSYKCFEECDLGEGVPRVLYVGTGMVSDGSDAVIWRSLSGLRAHDKSRLAILRVQPGSQHTRDRTRWQWERLMKVGKRSVWWRREEL